ncbi:hypothetical protein GYMLUDRAFT_62046 [Collybiopsis luxurians FD-317 M1]|uniref:Uncharacterized protein n=1 Tax=Collybiopsis luxurians FD-317 M1 TaxID=944289 RepID=A0A0D0BN67_9AGAR|nr:hypothetical protein GYMLUDRAFT_62046 [Collybiopsis luxurians FD-317 M1]
MLRQMKRFVLPRPIFRFYPSSRLNSTQLVAWFICPISYTDSRRSNSVRDTRFRNTSRNLLWAPACDDLQPPGDVANHPFHANANIIDSIRWSSPSGLNDPDTIAPDPAPRNLSIELLSVGARDDLLVKGPQDDVAGCLLKAKIVDRIPGGFQFRLNDPETVASFRKGIALSAASPDDCSFHEFTFPGSAAKFPPGTHFDLHPGWYSSMGKDIVAYCSTPVRFSPLPSPHELCRRSTFELEQRLAKFRLQSAIVPSIIYWYVEPPWTVKIGRTTHLANRVSGWDRDCPNPLRVWHGAYVTNYGYSLGMLN